MPSLVGCGGCVGGSKQADTSHEYNTYEWHCSDGISTKVTDHVRRDLTFATEINDEYRRKKNPQRWITEEEKNTLKVFHHQTQQKLATEVIGVSFDAQ